MIFKSEFGSDVGDRARQMLSASLKAWWQKERETMDPVFLSNLSWESNTVATYLKLFTTSNVRVTLLWNTDPPRRPLGWEQAKRASQRPGFIHWQNLQRSTNIRAESWRYFTCIQHIVLLCTNTRTRQFLVIVTPEDRNTAEGWFIDAPFVKDPRRGLKWRT